MTKRTALATGSGPLRKPAAAVRDERQKHAYVSGETHSRDVAPSP
ncbi:hypothetical protein ACIF8T_27230 [Streptomyces sp. NPDC085946]